MSLILCRNLLPDSGGFQMVSLLDLAEIKEEGTARFHTWHAFSVICLRSDLTIGHLIEPFTTVIAPFTTVIVQLTRNNS